MKIADKSDLQALEEFHTNRTVFAFKNGHPLLFIEYLKRLQGNVVNKKSFEFSEIEVRDIAFDLTVDKFSNFPAKSAMNVSLGSKKINLVKQNGPDCRFYFKAYLNYVAKHLKCKPHYGKLEEESIAETFLQGFVRRHFNLSYLEAARKINPFWSRYNWKINDRVICIWLPITLEGKKRRAWLEDKIDDPDLARHGERERIQAIINREFLREKMVPIHDSVYIPNEEKKFPWPQSSEKTVVSLSKLIAEEKAENIHKQRPSIKALGKEKLKHLIIRIFEDICFDKYRDAKVAKDFHLSKATFSRFAGSQWLHSESALPDLWLNTASVLSTHPFFQEIIKKTGFWKQVESTLKRGAQNQRKRCKNE